MIDPVLNGKRVLIVDDEEELRKAMVFDFKRRGCEVFEASNGTIAFEIVCKNDIDIVVSDVRMPNGSGVELLEKIKKRNPHIPVVLLVTGFADLTETDASSKGAVGLIEKPIDRKKMIEIIHGAVKV